MKRGWIVGIVLGGVLSLGPVFGLLGTVIGVTLAFDAVKTADPSQKQALLASGISYAMNSTVIGLAVFPFGAVLLGCSIYMFIKSSRPAGAAESGTQ